MLMKLVAVAGVVTLVGCGSGKAWDGPGDAQPPFWPPSAGAGEGGISQGPVGGSGPVPSGGHSPSGGSWAGGESPVGGSENVSGEGGASEAEGGASTCGTGPVGGGSMGGLGQGGEAVGGSSQGGNEPNLNCLASVSHCFEAAANCFEFSPASNCDEIVAVCADMEADCDAAP